MACKWDSGNLIEHYDSNFASFVTNVIWNISVNINAYFLPNFAKTVLDEGMLLRATVRIKLWLQ